MCAVIAVIAAREDSFCQALPELGRCESFWRHGQYARADSLGNSGTPAALAVGAHWLAANDTTFFLSAAAVHTLRTVDA